MISKKHFIFDNLHHIPIELNKIYKFAFYNFFSHYYKNLLAFNISITNFHRNNCIEILFKNDLIQHQQ